MMNGSEVWLTPQSILEPLGEFDLDPCSLDPRPWPTAKRHIAPPDDGLSAKWEGRVWLNPPFGKKAPEWLAKMAEHNCGTALIPARTETKMFFDSVWGKASAICFLKGRPHFHHPDGSRAPFNSGAPICLVAYGVADAVVLRDCSLGYTVLLW